MFKIIFLRTMQSSSVAIALLRVGPLHWGWTKQGWRICLAADTGPTL